MGTLINNPGIKIQEISRHALERMGERGVSKKMVEEWVKNGKALEQTGDKILYVTKEGAAVVTKAGKLITAYGKKFFDSNMKNLINQLFGK